MTKNDVMYTTLGGTNQHLDGASHRIVWPSTLTYQERLKLQRENPTEYNRVYGQTANYTKQTVWSRLNSDAHARFILPRNGQKYTSPDSIPEPTTGSGWKSNWKWEEVNNKGPQQKTSDPALLSLHPITLHHYQKKFGVDFMAAARPQTETTNQMLRPLGAYDSDAGLAEKMHMRPVNASFAEFQPDVKASRRY